MASTSQKKLREAEAHITAAEKQLKTTLSRWKPNYDVAADEYTKAAQCYRLVPDIKNSMNCSRLAAENYKLNKSFFHAAKALETAIIVGKDETIPPEKFEELALEAASLYREHGSGDSASAILAKTAKIVRNDDIRMAIKMYQQAAEASYSESSSHSAIEYTSIASRLLVDIMMYDAAIESVILEIGYHLQGGNTGAVGRLVVVGVLIQLARGDLVAAEKVYREWGSNCEQAEMNTLEMLLQGMDDNDDEMVLRALKAPFIRSMDVEYARLATRIPVPVGSKAAAAAADNDENQEAEDLQDQDQAGGLC